MLKKLILFSKFGAIFNGFQWFSIGFPIGFGWILTKIPKNPPKSREIFEKSTYLDRQRELGGEPGHF